MIDAVMALVLAASVGGAVAWLVLFVDDSLEQVPAEDA